MTTKEEHRKQILEQARRVARETTASSAELERFLVNEYEGRGRLYYDLELAKAIRVGDEFGTDWRRVLLGVPTAEQVREAMRSQIILDPRQRQEGEVVDASFALPCEHPPEAVICGMLYPGAEVFVAPKGMAQNVAEQHEERPQYCSICGAVRWRRDHDWAIPKLALHHAAARSGWKTSTAVELHTNAQRVMMRSIESFAGAGPAGPSQITVEHDMDAEQAVRFSGQLFSAACDSLAEREKNRNALPDRIQVSAQGAADWLQLEQAKANAELAGRTKGKREVLDALGDLLRERFDVELDMQYVGEAEAATACRVCGCTEDDCSQCIAKTGSACHWIEPGLCSACVCKFCGKGEPVDAVGDDGLCAACLALAEMDGG